MASKNRDSQELRIYNRALKVRQYRLAGFTYQQIADKLDIGVKTVRADLERIKVEFPQRTIKELTAEQNAKLEMMMQPHYVRACAGDVKATDTMIRLLDHQAKLFGLYEPEVDTGQAAAQDALNALMGSLVAAATKQE